MIALKAAAQSRRLPGWSGRTLLLPKAAKLECVVKRMQKVGRGVLGR